MRAGVTPENFWAAKSRQKWGRSRPFWCFFHGDFRLRWFTISHSAKKLLAPQVEELGEDEAEVCSYYVLHLSPQVPAQEPRPGRALRSRPTGLFLRGDFDVAVKVSGPPRDCPLSGRADGVHRAAAGHTLIVRSIGRDSTFGFGSGSEPSSGTQEGQTVDRSGTASVKPTGEAEKESSPHLLRGLQKGKTQRHLFDPERHGSRRSI